MAASAGSSTHERKKPSDQKKKWRSRGVTHLQFIRTGNILTTIPKTRSWFNGRAIGKSRDRTYNPPDNIIELYKFFCHHKIACNGCEDSILLGLFLGIKPVYLRFFPKKYLNKLKN